MLLVPLSPNGDVNISKYGGVSTSLGQKTSANSIPVTLASDILPLPTDIQQVWHPDEFSNYSLGLIAIGYDRSYGQFGTIPLSDGGQNVPVAIQNVVTSFPYVWAAVAIARGKIAAGSLTNAYATLLTMGGVGAVLFLANSTDQSVLFSYDNGTTDHIELDAGENVVIDFAENSRYLPNSTIKAKWVSAAPAVGSVRASLLR